ncbi:hypothetical protein MD588_13610 [Photobacterium sp. SDRW27]|uniref:hypothetical protein n=1 Tax=Photobacterium obscurum TaxID=2829490 RepID=UPI0022434859|nr:hypothetical protein [Photobacterium obscurum]MCW8329845.1 hypothetical protein [Photobacterium obscurum]
MTLTTKQLLQAYDVLTQGVVCLDDNLRQGVLVYVESLLVEQGMPRDKYLSLDDLRCDYPFVRMGSYMPIDFFSADSGANNVAASDNDANFKPISIKLCTVSLQDGPRPAHCWQMMGTYRADHVIEAINALLEILSNKHYFNYCATCNMIRPTGYLDEDQVCEYCCEELLGAA